MTCTFHLTTPNVFIPTWILHRYLFRWVWPKTIVQAQLDAFIAYWNSHVIRSQRAKYLPSGGSPNEVFDNPLKFGYEDRSIAVPSDMIATLRAKVNEDLPREEAFRWVSDSFEIYAQHIHVHILGSREIGIETGWDVFCAMRPHIREYVALGYIDL